MKLLIICVLAVALCSAQDAASPPACVLGICPLKCPAGTHLYALGCGYKTPEPTCLEPNPVPETAMLCDYSACYCDAPTVRDQNTDQCVLLENCCT